jgi:hypothetical protein
VRATYLSENCDAAFLRATRDFTILFVRAKFFDCLLKVIRVVLIKSRSLPATSPQRTWLPLALVKSQVPTASHSAPMFSRRPPEVLVRLSGLAYRSTKNAKGDAAMTPSEALTSIRILVEASAELKDDTQRKVLLRGVVVVAQKGLGVAPDGVAECEPNVLTVPMR